ncbi:uncharacterized protein LOC135429791 [Drosophila montana]|uniref:uncharacterized protein LOC135429791 n=1 Tax=Drosophila montana TaxID=40370 RepID=UPI00313DFBA0
MTNLLNNYESSTADVNDGNRLINKIVDDIFQLQQCHYEESDSQPELPSTPGSTPSFVDRRLKYWKDMIRQRRAKQLKLCLATGRQPQQLLLNVSNREEQSIKRILEHISRRDSCTTTAGLRVDPLEITFAKPQDYVEIVGLPKQVSLELDGAASTRSRWCDSQLLASRLLEKEADIKKVVEYCPDIDELELIGRNIWLRQLCERLSGHTISLLTPAVLSERALQISMGSNTSLKLKPVAAFASQLAVLINGTTYRRYRPEYSPILERRFVCNPYERSLRTIMRIENNGREAINFSWNRAEFFAYNNTLFNSPNEVFVFDTEPFLLRPGDVREVSVLFRPSKVGIVKQRWLLKTYPRIFFRCPCALTLNMHGRCTPPLEYLQLIGEYTHPTIRDCRKSATVEQLPTPIPLEPPRTLIPFARELEESEAFNRRNVGFHCERDTEIEGLKRFFCLVRPDLCNLEWDYSVSMLIELVCSKEDERLRVNLFEQLQLQLSELRGRTTPLSLSDAPAKLRERQRTRYIYVRGIISNSIELWEQKIWALSAQILKLAERRQQTEVESSSVGARTRKRLLHSKSFRDSIYIYTYYQLCDVAENIVSVIESTEQV